MSAFWLTITVLILSAFGVYAGRAQSLRVSGGDARKLHSLPKYHSSFVALGVLIPCLFVLVIWLFAQPMLIERGAEQMLNASGEPSLVMSDVRRVADGLGIAVAQGALSETEARAPIDNLRDVLGSVGVALGNDVTPDVLSAAQDMRAQEQRGNQFRMFAVLGLAALTLVFGLSRITPEFRARNAVERVVLALLITAASFAILTTVGIVLSMIFETRNFFGLHSWKDFFFGVKWAPNFRGDSELSILPLLWGTIYISLIALLVSVPIGLFAAIYLSEYAGPKTRGVAKPLLEILAGIPTIVYGLFALLTIGPLLLNTFGSGGLLGVEWMSGATAVLTAGLVMGIMLIPFVSSLSDDIINAVPQAMRDGSLGLGATKSETIRQVVIPAALPGIVGAILLAASRAIGETMIVVLGAGAIAKFSANPLDAMTTITTRIVSQLTGDGDFASPETLVAFALGLTLFVLTLGLNIIALYIVRKYREQYE
jgi:phosphate transport system permease protein